MMTDRTHTNNSKNSNNDSSDHYKSLLRSWLDDSDTITASKLEYLLEDEKEKPFTHDSKLDQKTRSDVIIPSSPSATKKRNRSKSLSSLTSLHKHQGSINNDLLSASPSASFSPGIEVMRTTSTETTSASSSSENEDMDKSNGGSANSDKYSHHRQQQQQQQQQQEEGDEKNRVVSIQRENFATTTTRTPTSAIPKRRPSSSSSLPSSRIPSPLLKEWQSRFQRGTVVLAQKKKNVNSSSPPKTSPNKATRPASEAGSTTKSVRFTTSTKGTQIETANNSATTPPAKTNHLVRQNTPASKIPLTPRMKASPSRSFASSSSSSPSLSSSSSSSNKKNTPLRYLQWTGANGAMTPESSEPLCSPSSTISIDVNRTSEASLAQEDTTSPVLLSPEIHQELSDRQDFLESSWKNLEIQGKNLDFKFQALEEQHQHQIQKSQISANSNEDKSRSYPAETANVDREQQMIAWKRRVQLQHAQELRNLKLQQKNEIDEIVKEHSEALKEAADAAVAAATQVKSKDEAKTAMLKEELEHTQKIMDQQQLEIQTAQMEQQTSAHQLAETRRRYEELEKLQIELTDEFEQVIQEKNELHQEVDVWKQKHQEMEELLNANKESLREVIQERDELNLLQVELMEEVKLVTEKNEELQDALRLQSYQLDESQLQCEALLHHREEQEASVKLLPSSSSSVDQSTNTPSQSIDPDKSAKSASIDTSSQLLDKFHEEHATELQEMERQMLNATMQLELEVGGKDDSQYNSSSSSLEMAYSRESPVTPSKSLFSSSDIQALSPIFPSEASPASSSFRLSEGTISEKEDWRSSSDEKEDDGSEVLSLPSTPRVDDLIDELGHERTQLLDQISPHDFPPLTNTTITTTRMEVFTSPAKSDTEKGDESVLDATLNLLHKMKDLLSSPDEKAVNKSDEKETSVLEQLEVLGEMMGFEDESLTILSASSSSSGFKGDAEAKNDVESSANVQNDGSLSNSDEIATDKNGERDDGIPSTVSIWKALVVELRRQVDFLEMDRSEVLRTTHDYLEEHKGLLQFEIDAAAATARRQGYEEGLANGMASGSITDTANMRCSNCQAKLELEI